MEGFEKEVRVKAFITETAGDYVFAVVRGVETNNKGTEYLVIETRREFTPEESVAIDAQRKAVKKGETFAEPAKPLERFAFYDMDATRAYQNRRRNNRPSAFLYALCTGTNPKGYSVFEIQWSGDKEKFAKAVRDIGKGVAFVLHPKELGERSSSASEGGGAPGAYEGDVPF